MGKVRIVPLDLTAGDGWSLLFRYLLPPDELGVRAPGIPAGWTARVQFRAHQNQATPLIDLTPVVDYAEGEFTATLTPTQTRTLPGVGFWAAALEAPDDSDGIELVRGPVSVMPEGVR